MVRRIELIDRCSFILSVVSVLVMQSMHSTNTAISILCVGVTNRKLRCQPVCFNPTK